MPKKLNVLHLAIATILAVAIGLLLKRTYHGDWFEFAGFITGVVGVYLVAVEHIINWPVGLVNVAVYGYVFYSSRLFADMSLQMFYFVLGVQGWWMWARGGANSLQLRITNIPMNWWAGIAAAIFAGTALYFPVIKHFNGAAPFLDSLLTVVSIIAQLLLNVKKIENWILWIVVDIVYIPLYISRDLYSTAFLYGVLLVLAICGLIGWAKTYRAESAVIAA